MNITLEQKDELNATICVSIEKDDYEQKVEETLKKYQRKASIPGFRPGKVPKSIIKKMYGPGVLVEEVNQIASQAISEYIQENKIEVLGQPTLSRENEEIDWMKTESFDFRFDIGVAPKFDIDISAKDKFTRYVVKVDEKMIDEEVERILQRQGETTEAEVTAENDIFYAQAIELGDNDEELEGGVQTEVSALISSVKHDDLKKKLIGLKRNDEVVCSIFELFDNNETEISTVLKISKEAVADLNPNFRLTVTDIKGFKHAEVNQELFDKLYGEGNVTDEAAFRDKIKEELEKFYSNESDRKLDSELIEKIVEKHNIPLPDDFLKRWLMDRHQDQFTDDNIDEKYTPEANYLKRSLLQDKIIAENKMEVTDEDIKAMSLDQTRRMFFGYNLDTSNTDYIENMSEENLKNDDYRSRIINSVVAQKVNDYIKSIVTIKDKKVAADDFFKILQEQATPAQG